MIIYICYSSLSEVSDEERKRRVEKLNSSYDSGDEIHIWIKQINVFLNEIILILESWGCKFSSVKSGKPLYDVLIDDNTDKSNHFFQSLRKDK